MDLTLFADLVAARADAWASLGIRHEFHRPSQAEPERSTRAAWVALETERVAGQLIAWTTGEADLNLISRTGGAERVMHRHLTDDILPACLDELTELVLFPPNGAAGGAGPG